MSESIDLFGARVMGLARMWRAEIDRRLEPLGLSEARWRAVRHLSRGGGELTQTKLAERLGIRGPTLVGQLDLLESDGWVERVNAPHDRRSKVVRLTANAPPLVAKIDTVIVGLRRELLSGMDEEALRTCSAVIADLCERLQSLPPPNPDGSSGQRTVGGAGGTRRAPSPRGAEKGTSVRDRG